VIFFRKRLDDDVEIVRVVQGARDLDSLFANPDQE
jgi:hypothetical protein